MMTMKIIAMMTIRTTMMTNLNKMSRCLSLASPLLTLATHNLEAGWSTVNGQRMLIYDVV